MHFDGQFFSLYFFTIYDVVVDVIFNFYSFNFILRVFVCFSVLMMLADAIVSIIETLCRVGLITFRQSACEKGILRKDERWESVFDFYMFTSFFSLLLFSLLLARFFSSISSENGVQFVFISELWSVVRCGRRQKTDIVSLTKWHRARLET